MFTCFIWTSIMISYIQIVSTFVLFMFRVASPARFARLACLFSYSQSGCDAGSSSIYMRVFEQHDLQSLTLPNVPAALGGGFH